MGSDNTFGETNFNPVKMKTGIELIKEERQRQIDIEGWSKDHDTRHGKGVLGRAGSCYEAAQDEKAIQPHNWPWSKKWWKPKDRLRNLVRAGALYLAEAERGYSDNDKLRGGHWDSRATLVADEIDRLQK